jgi:hypothetical protein
MGGGTWTADSFASYSTSKGRSYDATTCSLAGSYTSQEMYTQKYLNEKLDPKNVLRECLDSEEHPNTIPVILALDVTGSMGDAAVEVAKDINIVMTRLFKEVKDIEFMIMGIGDLSCDDAPIQISQFESDIRIAEQMDQVYFEYGGGGNLYESYTAAWYMGARHTKLDCLQKRGRKGIIITLGDEQLNPYLPKQALVKATGDTLQSDIETKDLFKEASEKFDIYHIDVDHRSRRDPDITSSWRKYLDENHYKSVELNAVTDTIVEMILGAIGQSVNTGSVLLNETVQTNDNGEIIW